MGSTYGKLIAPVQVEGKWYYHWDRSGDGTSDNATAAGQTPINGGVDWTTHVVLDDIFKYDINGIINPVAGTDTTDTFRYATLNGVKVALPTYGARLDSSGKAEPPQGLETFQNGTAASNTTTDNPLYNDLLAIWDAHNGAGTLPNGVSGVPTGWQFNNYYSATLSSSGHAHVAMNNGYVGSTSDANHNVCFVALQVL